MARLTQGGAAPRGAIDPIVGTTAHVDPSTGTVGVLLTQAAMPGPTPTPLMRRFLDYAFAA